MTRPRRILLTIVAAVLLLSVLVPPWTDGRSTSYARTRASAGWAPIFMPPEPQAGQVNVDFQRLSLEWAGIVFAGAVGWLWVLGKER